MRHYKKILALCLVLTVLLLIIPAFAQEEATGNELVLPITEDVNYIVRPADTVDAIGALFDVSPTCLAQVNELESNNRINVGQTLLIPVSCPVYGGDARDEGEMTVTIPREVVTYEETCTGYIVQQLDSLDVIGQKLDKSVVAIQVANEIEGPEDMVVGMCLTIPEDAPAYGLFPALDIPAEQDPSLGQGGGFAGEEYVVQPRDTIDVIAQRFDKSAVSIQLANNIANTKRLVPGMTLMIPDDAPPYGVFPAISAVEFTGELYTVENGDTLESIAEKFDVSLLALQLANSIDTEADLFPGRSILIPADVPAFGDDASFLGQGGGEAGMVHVVQPRETLDVISAFYNRDTNCIAEANKLEKPGSLQPGQVLVIDESCGPYVGELRPPLASVVSPANSSADQGGGSSEETITEEATPQEAVPLGETTSEESSSETEPPAPLATEEAGEG